MLNTAIQRILYKKNLLTSRSFLIAILVIGPTLGMISITNDAMGQPFKGLKYEDHLFRVSDSATLAIPPDDPGCPEGFVQAPNPELGCIANTITSEPNSDSPGDRGQSNAPPGVDPNECIPGNECPPECPEGTTQASPPLNPQLGCLPNTVTSEPDSDESPQRTSDSATLANNPDGQCPEGTVQASPPLNPQLGCLPNTVTLEPDSDESPQRTSDSATLAIPPKDECPKGFVQAPNPDLGCIANNETSKPSSKGNFVIQVTVVDDLDDDHNFYDLVDIYVKEHPQYGHFNIDLTDALYSDNSDGEYTTEIIMPSGLIEVDEEFEICIEGPVSGGDNGIICEDLTNSHQQQPEEVTITV